MPKTSKKRTSAEASLDGIDGKDSGDGNTDTSPAPPQISQRMHWHFCFNNYEMHHIDGLDVLFREICTDFIFQEEIGKQGTPHLQGAIKLKRPMRFTEFTPDRRIHWEPQRSLENVLYCSKSETKKPGGQVRFMGSYKPKKELQLITPCFWWQQEILRLIETEPDSRSVHWYWSESGDIGKSSFAKYLVAKRNALFFEEGKKADIMKLIFDAPEERLEKIVIDVPRDNGNNVSYKSIESIKNGMIYSSKYEGGYKLFNAPHIIVFANEPPQEYRLSSDRWHIKNIDEKITESNIEE